MKVFVTGGFGFIGSHTCVSLLEKSHEVIVFDNFSNCDFSIPDHVQKLGGKTLKFVEGDVRDFDKLFEVLKSEKPDVVLHFAGLKAVSESVKDPIGTTT